MTTGKTPAFYALEGPSALNYYVTLLPIPSPFLHLFLPFSLFCTPLPSLSPGSLGCD